MRTWISNKLHITNSCRTVDRRGWPHINNILPPIALPYIYISEAGLSIPWFCILGLSQSLLEDSQAKKLWLKTYRTFFLDYKTTIYLYLIGKQDIYVVHLLLCNRTLLSSTADRLKTTCLQGRTRLGLS